MKIKSYQLFENNGVDLWEYLQDLSAEPCDRCNLKRRDELSTTSNRIVYSNETTYLELIKQGIFYIFNVGANNKKDFTLIKPLLIDISEKIKDMGYGCDIEYPRHGQLLKIKLIIQDNKV